MHGTIYFPTELPGFIVEKEGNIIGLITYTFKNGDCEIVSLDSVVEDQGIGTKLIEMVLVEAREQNCRRVWLITTNDNIRAIRFYQKRGFQLIAVYPDEVTRSRKIKPEIPLLGDDGIPLRDELEFEYRLQPHTKPMKCGIKGNG